MKPVLLFVCFLAFSSGQSIAQRVTRFAVLINEIMADPSPVIGLPASEYIELTNCSTESIELKGWKITDGSSTAIINTGFRLAPNQFVLLCPPSAQQLFPPDIPLIGLSNFPSLNNDADQISLYSANGELIHSISYSVNWHENPIKAEGGWSLELIDVRNPCGGAGNWASSRAAIGGSPGSQNSVAKSNPDRQAPALLRTYSPAPDELVAVFDEPLDSFSAANPTRYQLNPGRIIPSVAIPQAPAFKTVWLKWNIALPIHTQLQLQVGQVTDCAGNELGMRNLAKAGRAVPALPGDLIINELLFNPKPGSEDYVELYNRSPRIIDLRQIRLANRNSAGAIDRLVNLSTGSWYLFPGEYLALHPNPSRLNVEYPLKAPEQVLALPALPNLPDDKGNLTVLNEQGDVLDELDYQQQWHFTLLATREGVALERINYNRPTQDPQNWSSAASVAGYGTPGYANSQLYLGQGFNSRIDVAPKLFSPNLDGVDDLTHIRYQLPEPGYLANLVIYNAGGIAVRNLFRNARLGLEGAFSWDGTNDARQLLPPGIYIIVVELFNISGQVRRYKIAVTLARGFG